MCHLEDFTADVTLDAKHIYERHVSLHVNVVIKFRADNGRFAAAAFLEDACNNKKYIKLFLHWIPLPK